MFEDASQYGFLIREGFAFLTTKGRKRYDCERHFLTEFSAKSW